MNRGLGVNGPPWPLSRLRSMRALCTDTRQLGPWRNCWIGRWTMPKLAFVLRAKWPQYPDANGFPQGTLAVAYGVRGFPSILEAAKSHPPEMVEVLVAVEPPEMVPSVVTGSQPQWAGWAKTRLSERGVRGLPPVEELLARLEAVDNA